MQLWISSLLFFVVFAFAQQGFAPIDNGFRNFQEPEQVSISVISPNKAEELFKKFVQNKDIPFRFPLEGCYARAHEMARMAEKEQVVLGKAFVEGMLQVKTDLKKYPTAQWGWHVAPIVYVKMPSGKNEMMVMDPSLFKKPVPLKEWKERMLDTSDGFEPKIWETYFGTRFQLNPKYFEKYKKEWSLKDLQVTKGTLKKLLPYQDTTTTSQSNNSGGLQQATGAR